MNLYCFRLALLLVLIGGTRAQAQDSSKPLDLIPHPQYVPSKGAENQRLEKDLIETREKIVFLNGVMYKQVEFRGDRFLINASQAETFVDCKRVDMPEDSFAVDGSVSVAQHTKLFMESLRQKCNHTSNSIDVSPDLRDSNIGVKIKGDGPDASEKRIFVNPLKQMGSVGTSF